MRPILTIAIAVTLAACATKKPEPQETPPKELVTRKMEPFAERPVRPAGKRVEPRDEDVDRVESLLSREASTMEIVGVIAIQWADGKRSIYATHVNYPAGEMSEEAFEAAIDDAAAQTCDEQFQGCLDATTRCDEDAYDACVRASYRNPYVYASAHLGVECGVFGVSKFDGEGPGLAMTSRKPLDSMVCDFDALSDIPAANDLDGDSGPELVYSWFASTDRETEQAWPRENIVILDATSLEVQYRMSADNLRDDVSARNSTVGLDVQDPNNDGMYDLVVSRVDIRGYCPEMGFALDEKFVVSTDEYADEEPPCQMSVHRSVLPYDGESDRWGRVADPANAQEPQP